MGCASAGKGSRAYLLQAQIFEPRGSHGARPRGYGGGARRTRETSRETEKDISLTFYGSSFITDHMGNIIKTMDEKSEGIISQEFDLNEIKKYRQSWGNFRDRRPDLYKKICDF